MITAAIMTALLSTAIGTDQELRSAESFAKDFNAAIGKPRVVAIIAPT